jgi:TolB-like protein/class 3 adenylate cyclase
METQQGSAGGQRHLAAIVAADVAGYSRLVERDEAGTVARLKAIRREIVEPLVERHGGRIANLAGDGAIAEFPSVVEAVEATMAIQAAMAKREAALPEPERVRFRIGVNLGDVIAEDGDLLGNGVNVAARLEQLCPPGEVLISGTAFDQVEDRLPFGFEYRGEQRVKNIDKPVRVYRVLTGGTSARWRWRRLARPTALTASVMLLLALGGTGAWLWAGGDRAAAAEPAVAVLPFANMSGDPGQDYFSDGLTEDIITELARYQELLVIARNSTFQFKGQAADVREVGRRLGADYVLEGSVRRDSSRIRITAQLIDAESGTHLWAQRWDRPATDLFAVQDEIATALAGTLVPHLRVAEERRVRTKPPKTLGAYDLTRRCIEAKHVFMRESNLQARELCRQALELDPGYALAWTYLGGSEVMDYWFNLTGTASLDAALVSLRRAAALDPMLPITYQVLSQAYMAKGQWDEMLAAARKGVELGPSDAENWILLADALGNYGLYAEGVKAAERAIRLNPLPPNYYPGIISYQLYMLGEHERALSFSGPCAELELPHAACLIVHPVLLYHIGHVEAAKAALPKLQRYYPDMTWKFAIDVWAKTRDPAFSAKLRADLLALGVEVS